MSDSVATADTLQEGVAGAVKNWTSPMQTFQVPWGKAMMWIFLVSDTFIFTCFLTAYLHVRLTTTEPWPVQGAIFALSLFGSDPIPLILIALMTFILITSSGTMALAVNMGYRKDKEKAFWLICATAFFGLWAATIPDRNDY